jgi:hypothetical protein
MSPDLKLVEFKPIAKGALRGFATIELPSGLTLFDCAVLVSNGKAWASLPSKPLFGKDGQQLRDDNNKPRYVPLLRWKSREQSDRFSEAVVKAVRFANPDALTGDR